MPRTIDAVVFDWGGTLSVWADLDLADMWRVAARHLDPAREEELTQLLTDVEGKSWARVRHDQRATTLAELLAEASTASGLDVAAAVMEEAAAGHLDAWAPHIEHTDDAAPTLAACRSLNLRTGLLSNTHWPREFHERFLARDGLDRLLDVRVYTSELKRTKPHPLAFKAVLDALDVPASRTVFVGDRPYDDIYGAQALGMRAVLMAGRPVDAYDAVKPDATITRLSELIGVLDEWLDPRDPRC